MGDDASDDDRHRWQEGWDRTHRAIEVASTTYGLCTAFTWLIDATRVALDIGWWFFWALYRPLRLIQARYIAQLVLSVTAASGAAAGVGSAESSDDGA